APLRDLAPGAVPGMVAALRAWSGRCEATLQGLEAQIAEVRADAARRAAEKSAWDERLAALVEEEKRASEKGPGGGGAGSRKSTTLTTGHGHVPGSGGGGGRAPRFGKRGSNVMMEGSAEDIDDEAMDVDDSDDEVDGKKRASRRKL
ncbi:MAG: hypothetical protein OK454_08655, partial [Thaumarchaeota archaeon]|nr:hypothetical protein [Nitrososphaerota archaeon]